jgi:hypothetical protein
MPGLGSTALRDLKKIGASDRILTDDIQIHNLAQRHIAGNHGNR